MESLQDLLNTAQQYWPETNIGGSPGTYVPPGLKLNWFPIPTAMGMVHPWVPNRMFLNTALNDNESKLRTLAHEAAHIKQPTKSLALMFDSPEYKRMQIPYTWYYNKDDRPPVQEILASLREFEALAPKGKTWETTDPGKQFMRYYQEKNPNVSYRDMLQTVDRNMFPEYQVMHESPEKPSFLQRLFGR